VRCVCGRRRIVAGCYEEQRAEVEGRSAGRPARPGRCAAEGASEAGCHAHGWEERRNVRRGEAAWGCVGQRGVLEAPRSWEGGDRGVRARGSAAHVTWRIDAKVLRCPGEPGEPAAPSGPARRSTERCRRSARSAANPRHSTLITTIKTTTAALCRTSAHVQMHRQASALAAGRVSA
jgi:hypothetical protein